MSAFFGRGEGIRVEFLKWLVFIGSRKLQAVSSQTLLPVIRQVKDLNNSRRPSESRRHRAEVTTTYTRLDKFSKKSIPWTTNASEPGWLPSFLPDISSSIWGPPMPWATTSL